MPRQSREKSGTGIYQMIIRTVPLIVSGILLAYLISSCSGTRINSSEPTEDSIVVLSTIVRHSDDDIQYFIQLRNEHIFLTDGNYLHHLYEDKYCGKYKDYNAFLSYLLDKPSYIEMEDSINNYCYYYATFIEDKVISTYYIRYGLESLQKQYCEKEKDKIKIKSNFASTKLTIAYYHWLNGYVYHFGGMSGYEYLSKM